MREILFRGKRVDDREWVYGFICQNTVIGKECCVKFVISTPTEIPFGGEWYEVDVGTICEYTGLTDKNGTKIFEGDVLQSDNGHVGCVTFGGLAQFEKYCKCHKEFGPIYPDNETVIGNIHDNPELLKGA